MHKNTQTKTALKFYDIKNLCTAQRKKSLKREIIILSKLNHINIMKLYEAFVTPTHIVLALEYINGMSLHALLKSKSDRKILESEAKPIYRQLLNAIRYCHSKSVTHRYFHHIGILNWKTYLFKAITTLNLLTLVLVHASLIFKSLKYFVERHHICLQKL